jgi:hypothetical protein
LAIAKLDNVEIPNITSQEMTPELIADESRTASNKLKRDISGVKRQWKITASRLTSTEKDAILTLLSDKRYSAVQFWLDEFGDEPQAITAYVTVESVKRHPFGKNGVWHSDGVDIELTIAEQ